MIVSLCVVVGELLRFLLWVMGWCATLMFDLVILVARRLQ